ncbi:MAG: ABC transporter substrate-binding protein [Pseudomonadota bacterium]
MQIFQRLAVAVALSFGAVAAMAETTLIVGITREPPHLDPTRGTAQAVDRIVYGNVFEGLTRFDETGVAQRGLAQSWRISEDGLRYTFNIAAGVTFHDGTVLDAEDVKFSLDRARAEESENARRSLLANITEVTVTGPLQVAVTLAEPDGGFLATLAYGDAVIVAPESSAAIGTNPVGTGPYRFEAWEEGSHITLTRNPFYWGRAPQIETATFRFLPDTEAATEAVMSGDVDVFAGFRPNPSLRAISEDPRFDLLIGSTEGETLLSMNNARPPFDDRRVREAISIAINRTDVIATATAGLGTPIGTHFPPHHPDYVDLTSRSPHDPDRSRGLLAEAGYPEGFTVTLTLPPTGYARGAGAVIADQLASVAITAEIAELSWQDWIEQVFRSKDFDLTIVSHTEPMDIGIYADPDYYFQYDNLMFRTVIGDLTRATDAGQRSVLRAQAQTIIADDYVNGFLFSLPVVTVVRKGITGVWQHQPVPAVDLAGIRIAED